MAKAERFSWLYYKKQAFRCKFFNEITQISQLGGALGGISF